MSEDISAKRKIPVWIWIVAVVAGLALLGTIFGGGESGDGASETEASQVQSEDTTGTEEPEESVEPDESAADSVLLRMAVIDETSGGVPDDFEVWIRGTGSWFFAQDSVTEEAGPFAVAEPASFFIYPQGRDSTEIEVSVEVSEEVIPGSTRDTIFITVFDDELEVSGTSIPGGEVRFSR